MSKVDGKFHGDKIEFELSPAHLFGEALDTFLTNDTIILTFSALISLSISLELYVKKYLQIKISKYPDFIFKNIGYKDWEKIEKALTGSRNDKRKNILSKFNEANKNKKGNPINFSVAISIFCYFYRVRKQVQDDLNKLRNYRNGLFHWEAENDTAFELSKLLLRLFEWMLEFIENEQGHLTGGDFNIIDPMGLKRQNLEKLRLSIRSENAFNIQRRVFKHRETANVIAQANDRLRGIVFIPQERAWAGQKCPACNSEALYLYNTSRLINPITIWCKRCDLTVSGVEYESVRLDDEPSLEEIFGK